MSARKSKAKARSRAATEPKPDTRIRECLDKLDGALLSLLAGKVPPISDGIASHNLAVAARAAMDLRSILTMGGGL